MPIRAPADQRRFEEALAWFRQRVVLTDDEFNALEDTAKQHAKAISGVSQLNMVQSIFDDLEASIAAGENFDGFKKRARLKLLRAWGRAAPHRIEAIYRTETQKAYQAGRFHQLTHPSVKNLRPFWEFDAIIDTRTSAICQSHNGTIAHQDDPYWADNYPPLHVNCRSGVRALRMSDVERRGGPTGELPTVRSQPGFGGTPQVDGFGELAEPDTSNVDAELAASFRDK